MKKTFNINIAGYPFTIDDDAYSMLSDYLDTIESAFRNVDYSQELILDIESRVAELLSERISEKHPILTLDDVKEVIGRVGKPEEMVEEDSMVSVEIDPESGEVKEEVSGTTTPPPFVPPLPPASKKLYRDPNDSMLGGVCSGLAWFLSCDVTWVRLATVLISIITSGTGVLAYLVLWIVIPEAKTPLERMQMMGERPTMENIGKTVTDNFTDNPDEKYASRPNSSSSFADKMAQGFGIIAKILVAIGLIIAFPLLIALIIGLLGCVFALIMIASSSWIGVEMPWENGIEQQCVVWSIVCGIGGILAIGCPLFFLVRKGMKKKSLSRGTSSLIASLCVLGFITAAVSTGILVAKNKEYYENKRYEREQHANRTEWIDEWEEIDDVGNAADSTDFQSSGTQTSTPASESEPKTVWLDSLETKK